MGILIGAVIGLFGAMLFCLATYNAWDSRRQRKQQQHRPPGPTGAGQKADSLNRWSLVMQILSALLGLGGLIFAIYFGLKPSS